MPRHFEVEIDGINFEGKILEILKQIREDWNVKEVHFRTFTEGITNKLIGTFWHSISEMVLFRINGNKTDLLLDRKAEVKNMKFLNKFGFAPQIYATFSNGICYKFTPGVILTTESVFEGKIWRLVAQKMAQLHKVPIADEEKFAEPMIRRVGLKYLELIPEKWTDSGKGERISASFPKKSELKSQFAHLLHLITSSPCQITFCHNDLLPANIIFTSETSKISFIDFEYAEVNYQYFDIGNHFAKMAGAASDQGIDYSRFPSKDFQKKWLRYYLEEFYGREVTANEVKMAYKDVKKFVAASHFLWTCWCLIQAEYSKLDFDYVRLGQTYYDEYLHRMELLSKSHSHSK